MIQIAIMGLGTVGTGVAKVVAENARVIIMDEPTSSLSREEVIRLQKIIFRLKERGVAIIYISHFTWF